ncbi:hypothetical protein AQUCO_02200325v1 [Aquilegia coerulea]|uniref:Serine aminopeptidase S33 domain-containing protein n=1 Tax=Aquilegia coerulea TaxID=218851 RepID=A0A2G5DE75_AQUCA|nr:hypothetical protein AQUCO_02200325v1 [Aquilegia coerulea]
MLSGLVGACASLPWAFQKSFSTCSSNSFAIVTTSSIPSIPSSGSTFPSTHYLLQKLQPCRTRRILVPRIRMSQSKVDEHHPVVQVESIAVKNNHGENLVGLLHETGSKDLVILCHGFRHSKESAVMADLADAISKEGISVFRFDFAGNGEGSFQYGNYLREADDLRSVIQYLSGRNHAITTILGHSKGGDVVLLYASKYGDVPTIINVAGRYDLKKGIAEHLGKDFIEVIKRDGFIDVVSKITGQFRVTEESMMERLGTDMHSACLSIDNGCRVLTVHGSSDELISVEDAFAFAKIIPNHELHIIEGADHKFSKHQAELAEVVLNFIKTSIQEGKD